MLSLFFLVFCEAVYFSVILDYNFAVANKTQNLTHVKLFKGIN